MLASLLATAAAHAEVSGSIALLSDYRYRGISLSDEKPAVQAGLGYDHDSGWHAGAFASSVELGDPRRTSVQGVVYGGFAQRLQPALSWDASVAVTTFSRGDYDYAEVHAGIAVDKVSARLSYAPRYFGQHADALYAEVGARLPLQGKWSVFGHAGVLQLVHRDASYGVVTYGAVTYPHPDSGATRWDARAGIGFDFDRARLQLAWSGAGAGGGAYPVGNGQSRNAIVASLTRAF